MLCFNRPVERGLGVLAWLSGKIVVSFTKIRNTGGTVSVIGAAEREKSRKMSAFLSVRG